MKKYPLLSIFLAVQAAGQGCSSGGNCNVNEVCLDNECTDSIAFTMFDSISKFATGSSSATYGTSTSTTFENLVLQCPAISDQLREQQHFLWQGFVEYAFIDENHIYINGPNGNQLVVDQWGDRCESSECAITAARYLECGTSCRPETLQYPLTSDQNLDIDIYEPCNFVSNLSYDRVMPQLCGSNLYMDTANSNAMILSFGALSAGSANWHGSHTYLGWKADNQFIGVIAFLFHQLIIDGLSTANNVNVNQDSNLRKLKDLQINSPRSGTAIEVTNDVRNVVITQPVDEWANVIENLDIPDYYETFTVIVSSMLSIIFPDKPETMSSLINGLTGVFDVDSDNLNSVYLPKLQALTTNSNLTNEHKFILFRQLLGMACKLVFAFLWQEQILEVDFFLQPRTNEIAPDILPPLVSLFNFVSGFEHPDPAFQESDGIYPGDDTCRSKTIPHTKWHELSAMGLLDMAYLADCAAAIVNGSTSCAKMPNLNGKGQITKAEINAWVTATFPSNIPIFKDIVPIFVTEIFLIFDVTGDDKIDWNDISRLVDIAEDIANTVGKIINTIEDFIAMFENFCYEDAQCDTDTEFCNILQFGCRPRRNNGFFPCIKDSQCYSDRCVDTTRICAPKLEEGDTCTANKSCISGLCATTAGVGVCATKTCSSDSNCSSDEWCNKNYSPDICRPKRGNGFFPCIKDIQCESGRCVDTTRVCAALLREGDTCTANKSCISNLCATTAGVGVCGERTCNSDSNCSSDEWCNKNYSPDICRPKRPNGFFPCIKDIQCESGRCVDTSRVCDRLKNKGERCISKKECKSNRCRWFKCK